MRTELHFHLLPGVDDGPATDRDALDLARLAVADRTQRVVTTPHVHEINLGELPKHVARLRKLLTGAGIPLEVFPGGEISPPDAARLRPDQLEAIAQGPPGARWLLLEAPLWQGGTALGPAAARLHAHGYGLLIGHPERGSGLRLEELREIVRCGAVLQLNASSLAGLHGSTPARAAISIAESGLPFVVASDAHSSTRPPLLSDAMRRLSDAGIDADLIRAAVDLGPARLFEDGLPAGQPGTSVDLGLGAARRAA